MKKNHLNYVDSIKGIAMILVVWGHCGSKNYFYNTLYYIHLPIFIIISGCLLKYNNSWMKDNFSDILKKKTKQIMYPFFSFGFLSIIRFYYLNTRYNTNISLVWRIKEIFMLGFDACWFLPALYIGVILSIVFIKIATKKKKSLNLSLMFIQITMAIIACIIKHILWTRYISYSEHAFEENQFIHMLLIICRSLFFSFFILMGYILNDILLSVNKWNNKIKLNIIIALICILSVLVMITIRLGFVDLRTVYFKNTSVYLSIGSVGAISIIIICSIINIKSKILSYIGRNSLIIMGVHFTFGLIDIANDLWYKCSLSNISNNTVDSVMITIIVLLLSAIFVEIFNKSFPYILNYNKLVEKLKK